MMATSRRKSGRVRRVTSVLWTLAAMFSLGYFPTMFTGDPVIAMSAGPVLTLFFGAKTPSVRSGAFRGLWLGLAVGLGAWSALSNQPLPDWYAWRTIIFLLTPPPTCAIAAAIGAWVAGRRRQKWDQQWDQLPR